MKLRNLLFAVIGAISVVVLTGCPDASQEAKDAIAVDRQQSQFAKGQPVPGFDFSLERHLLIELYQLRNVRAATHSVWRSNTGMIEGDCASMGFGMPYDTSLTNPLKGTRYSNGASIVVEQAEPNGVFASKNTSATWVMCTGTAGTIEPVYIESKVTAYPYPLTIDYDTNRVVKNGASTVSIKVKTK